MDRRPFRIESGTEPDGEKRDLRNAEVDYIRLFDRVFRELADLRQTIVRTSASRGATEGEQPGGDGVEASIVRAEVESIQQAIARTKHEIVTLQVKGLRGDSASRVRDELDAVVSGTEVATETILSAAETIEDAAGRIIPRLQGADQALVLDIHKQAIRIFEACNFQDLTGQRISKVVQVLHFIEERVDSMMSIWGGAESFSSIQVSESPLDQKKGDEALLNGPALASDVNVVSQDDIDSLFA